MFLQRPIPILKPPTAPTAYFGPMARWCGTLFVFLRLGLENEDATWRSILKNQSFASLGGCNHLKCCPLYHLKCHPLDPFLKKSHNDDVGAISKDDRVVIRIFKTGHLNDGIGRATFFVLAFLWHASLLFFFLVIDICIENIDNTSIFVHVYILSWTFACWNMEKLEKTRAFLLLLDTKCNTKTQSAKVVQLPASPSKFHWPTEVMSLNPRVSSLADSNRALTWIEQRCIRLD